MVWILSSKVTSHIWQQKPEVLLLCQVLLEPNQRLHHHWFFWEHANTFRRLLKYAINHELERKKSYYRSSVKIWVLPTMPASYNQQFFFSIQTNLVWLNVESPNSGSWRMQQKKGKLIFLKNGLLWATPNNHQRGGLQSHSHIL